MLTKTEGLGTHRLNSNGPSTYRSNYQQNGEFEKRITDIKTKLTQIKNTINSEIETSFTGMNNTNMTQTNIMEESKVMNKSNHTSTNNLR